MRWLDGITDSMDMSLSKLWELAMERKSGMLQSKGVSRVFSNSTVQKATVLQCSAFFMVQLSHPYMTTGKTIALTRWTFVAKVMSLLRATKINKLN